MLVLLVVFSLVAIQSLVECKLKWFLFPSKFFLSTQHSSAEIFSHCIICSTAVHFPTSHDALHSLNSDSPGTGFYFPSCGKIKSAPLENLGEIWVAGEDWRYPQQFSLNTNWTLRNILHVSDSRMREVMRVFTINATLKLDICASQTRLTSLQAAYVEG